MRESGISKLILLTELFPVDMVMALPVMTVAHLLVSTNGNEGEYAAGITVVALVVSIMTIPLAVFLV